MPHIAEDTAEDTAETFFKATGMPLWQYIEISASKLNLSMADGGVSVTTDIIMYLQWQ